jgi:hypothetical protein
MGEPETCSPAIPPGCAPYLGPYLPSFLHFDAQKHLDNNDPINGLWLRGNKVCCMQPRTELVLDGALLSFRRSFEPVGVGGLVQL